MIQPEWDKVAGWAQAEIKAARDRLETIYTAEANHADRGRIKALRDLLALATPQVNDPAKAMQPPDYGITGPE